MNDVDLNLTKREFRHGNEEMRLIFYEVDVETLSMELFYKKINVNWNQTLSHQVRSIICDIIDN